MKRSLSSAGIILIALTSLLACSPHARDTAQEEANRELVLNFYQAFFNEHKVESASVIANNYIQHNPEVPDGKAPFVDYFAGYFAENPDYRSKVVRSAANDDLVWLHVHSTNGEADLGEAVIDIFRVENNQIVEHWDVIQSVPAESANDNTMF